MGLGFFYARAHNVNVNRNRVKRTLFIAGMLLLALPFSGKAQTTPTFVLGTSKTLNICQNDVLSLNPYLNVSDVDGGQIETWSVSIPPAHGTLNGFGSAPSEPSGSANIPLTTAVSYTPDLNFFGDESFQIRINDDHGDGVSFINIYVKVNGSPLVTLVNPFPSVCSGTTSTALMYTDSIENVGYVHDTFFYFGLAQTWVKPTGVSSVNFNVFGGEGGRNTIDGTTPAGKGGNVSGILNVSSVSFLTVLVASPGDSSADAGPSFGGGGNSYTDPTLGRGGSGGGSSDIRMGGTAISNRVVVAGGGGGNGWDAVNGTCIGGDGGGTVGIAGCTNLYGSFAKGGGTVNGGNGALNPPYPAGSNGAIGGFGGGDASHYFFTNPLPTPHTDSAADGIGGGGGGGWFGGGGGASSGGGGGSSFANAGLTSGVVNTSGVKTGAGLVVIDYLTVGTYSIDYDFIANNTYGFVDVPFTFPLPAKADGFPINIPPGTPAGIYNATLILSNGICTTTHPFTVTVRQTPDVNFVPNTTVCNGVSSPVVFGTTSGTNPTYTWTNSNTAIGVGSSGTGNISFTATNTGNAPAVGTFVVTPTEFGCTGDSTTFTITTNPQPSLTIGGPAQVCAGATSATIPFSNLVNVGTFSNTYSFLDGNTLPQVFNVPANVTSVTFDVMGAIGGSDDQSLAPAPGKGARIHGNLSVTPGNPLNIYVGSRGFNGSPSGAAGGYNGGGNGINWPGIGCGGAGGGASDIRLGGIALSDRVVVAGGGGGSGYDAPLGYAGGDGGGIIGANSATNIDGSYAGGGTQSAGGIGATYTSQISGSNGGLGFGGNGSPQGVSGAGGGGYYGGGGGVWTGGGGGSSYSDPSITNSVVHFPGDNLGDGSVTITYQTIGTYTITWSGAAPSEGFADVLTPTVLPDSTIIVSVPPTAAPGTYTGTLTLDNGLCTKTFPITITINPLPDVILTPNGNQVMCNGATSIAVAFSNSTLSPDVKYIWTNDNPGIGLPATDSVDIPAFTAVNTGTTSQVANIVVTPVETVTGCVGIPALFSYSVNPTPHLTATSASVCSSTPVNFIASSGTPSTTFSWSRTTTPGISNTPNTGTGDVTESLTNVTDSVSIQVFYQYNLVANSCTNTEIVTVTVKPKPVLQGLQTQTVCENDLFPNALIETSLVSGTAYSWDVLFTPGSTVPAGHYSGPGAVTDVMGNLTPNPITVQYNFHTEANGCFDDKAVYIIVKPLPELVSGSSHTDAHTSVICTGSPFSYTAASATPGFSYIWNRISVSGITVSTPNLGTGAINDVLVNTTNGSLTVPYEFHLSADGCSSPADSVLVTVDPMPSFTSTKDTFVCGGVTFLYTPTATTPAVGTTFDWIRTATLGLSFPGGATSSGPINTAYIDTTTHPVVVSYYFTTKYSTCQHLDTVHITVNPTPKYTASLDTVFRCYMSNFPNYAPASSTSGATFAWSRPYTPGITDPAATGTGDLNSELLKNSTNFSIPVIYTYTVSANGCVGDVVKLPVVIHPNPTLSSDLTPHYTCNGVPFYYPATSYVAGATFKWDRFIVKGIYGDSVNSSVKHYYSTNFGVGDVYETLFDTDYVTHRVLYLYRVTANGCTNLTRDSVFVNVVPGPRLPQILTNTPLSPCSNTQYQTFSASEAPVSGVVSYDWYANNATVWSSTKDHQSIYVNFNFSGMSYVRLTGTSFANGCKTSDSLFVNVSSGFSETFKLVYYQGQFICLRSDMDTYQWGYDDIETFTSVTIPGATEQNIYLPGADMQRYRYWVITTHNGCTQKSYYNSPLGVNEVNTADVTDIKLYPNPTKDNINVLINTTLDGNMQVELLNLLGQKLSTVIAADHKATIDVSNLPGGCYLVDCYRDGVKIGTSRFIKN